MIHAYHTHINRTDSTNLKASLLLFLVFFAWIASNTQCAAVCDTLLNDVIKVAMMYFLKYLNDMKALTALMH